VYQNQHRGWLAVAYEVGIVLCFLKAPVDAYRVASGQKQAPGDPNPEFYGYALSPPSTAP
jgi:hypothetical protein